MRRVLKLGVGQRLLAVAVAVATVAAVAGCGSDDEKASTASDAGGNTPVRLAFLGGLASLPIHVAETQGIFEKHGIDVELNQAVSNADFAPALGRQYDVVNSTASDLLQAVERGIDIRAVTGLGLSSSDNPNAVVITPKGSQPAKSIQDLKGKRVGVVVLTAGITLALRSLMVDAKMNPTDITFVPVPFPTMVDQLKAGRIDAAVPATPFSALAIKQGLVPGFDPAVLATGDDPALGSFLSTSTTWAKEHPKAVAGLRAALGEAMEYIAANPEEARAEAEAWLKLPKGLLDGVEMPPGSAEIQPEQLDSWIRILRATDTIKSTPSASELVITP